MKHQHKFLTIILAGGLLAACSSDEPTIGGEGMNSARITAGINTAASRANGSQWEADVIGVTVIDAPNSNMENLYRNVRYKTEALGGSAVFAPVDNEGIFFQDATETVTFSAYGPYRDWTVAPDDEGFNTVDMADSQMGREAQKSIDFIHATGATASNASPTVTFTADYAFRHVMSRLEIVVKISDKGDFSDNALTDGDYSLGGMKLQALFNPYTGEAKASDAPAVNDWYLNTLPSATEDGVVSYTAILPPQTLETTLTFTAKVDGQTYANSSLIKPALESGKSYRYTITVSKTGLTVSGCTITDWTVGTELDNEATFATPYGEKDLHEATVGDYYMRDGTLVDKDDVLTDRQKNACIGIVFTTDPYRMGEGAKQALADKGIEPHGLVMAIANVRLKGVKEVIWGQEIEVPGIQLARTTSDIYKQVDGYSDTQYVCTHYADNLAVDFPAFYYASIFGKTNETAMFAAPETSTGWFIPSGGNFWNILSDLGKCGDELEKYHTSQPTGGLYHGRLGGIAAPNINKSMEQATYAELIDVQKFWTSTQTNAEEARYFNLNIKGDLDILTYKKTSVHCAVRCVLAF